MNSATRTNCTFTVADHTEIKDKMLKWASRFSIFCMLDNNGYTSPYHSEECLLAAGAEDSFQLSPGCSLEELNAFIGQNKDWLFGHLSYDLKEYTAGLPSSLPDRMGFPVLYFFRPKVLLRLQHNQLEITGADPQSVYDEIRKTETDADPGFPGPSSPITIQNRLSRQEYIHIIQQLQQHIQRGDCYEINYCQEFFAEPVTIDPVSVYKKLSRVSPNPFSALYRYEDRYVICASPERFLKKTGNKILSQPIKGTSRRNLLDELTDEKNKTGLYHSAKDRSENVMVVDLVRNDLSRICKEGTVEVDELFGVYSFPQVHQLISTISGELKDGVSFSSLLEATFPMGSMTGAPKRKVMQLIEQYEKTQRGIFSGALGYIAPGGDFDFNVVIRSILYNENARYVSLPAGSGITFYSDPEKEWEECLLKAEAMQKVLRQNI